MKRQTFFKHIFVMHPQTYVFNCVVAEHICCHPDLFMTK